MRADRFATSPRERLTAPVGQDLTRFRCADCDAPMGHDPRLSGPAAREWRHLATTPAAAARLDADHLARLR